MRKSILFFSLLFTILIVGVVAVRFNTSRAQSASPLLYTTLDNAVSVGTPVNGTGTGSLVNTTPANDFLAGHTGNGVRLDALNDYVRFQETDGSVQNVELTSGTVDFWFKPSFNHTDGIIHNLFAIGDPNVQNGTVRFFKHTGGNGNALSIEIKDGSGNWRGIMVPGTQYSWSAGQWVNLRFTWDGTVASGVQNMRIYVDGTERAYSGTLPTGPFPMPAESQSKYIYVGNTAPPNGHRPAVGVIDELKVYAGAMPPADSAAPSVPNGLTANVISSSQINLSWTASTDNVGVAGYQMFRGGVQIATTTQTNYQNTGLTPSTTYTYTVAAFDAAGNVSAQSTSVNATTQAAADSTAPTVPSNVTGRAITHNRIDVEWSASTDNVGVTGYAVFRDGVEIGTTALLAYYDTNLAPSMAHVYTVKAFDAAGNRSAASLAANTATLADAVPPSISLGTSALSSTTVITADAFDLLGITSVKFFADGVEIGEDTSAPFSISWNTLSVKNGTRVLSAEGRDATGNITASAPVSVTVWNRVIKDIPYCTGDGANLLLDMYYPALGADASLPVVIHLFGAGWQSSPTGKNDLPNWPELAELNKRGYLVIAANYRGLPAYGFPAFVEDAKCAVRFLRANAAAYGIDLNHIAVWGDSAGGHIAAMVGTTDASAGLEGVGGWQNESSRVQAVVDYYGPADLTIAADWNPTVVQNNIIPAFGAAPGSGDPRLVAGSPVTYVTSDDPPFGIFHGVDDPTVVLHQSEVLYALLRNAGTSASFVRVLNSGHGFPPSGSDPTRTEIVQMMADFLDSVMK